MVSDKKLKTMIPEELMFKKMQIFSKSLLFIPLIILDIVVGYLLADTYRNFFKNWQKFIFFWKTETWPLLPKKYMEKLGEKVH